MSYSLPQKSLLEKQKGKIQVSSSSQSPPPLPNKARSKIQSIKDSYDARILKKTSKQSTPNQAIFDIFGWIIWVLKMLIEKKNYFGN